MNLIFLAMTVLIGSITNLKTHQTPTGTIINTPK